MVIFIYNSIYIEFVMSVSHCTVKASTENEYALAEPFLGDEAADPIFTCRQTTLCEF